MQVVSVPMVKLPEGSEIKYGVAVFMAQDEDGRWSYCTAPYPSEAVTPTPFQIAILTQGMALEMRSLVVEPMLGKLKHFDDEGNLIWVQPGVECEPVEG